MLVAVNAGHCPGLDPGAVGAYSHEADIVEKVAKVVCSALENVGYETLFIQENELEDITGAANNAGADIFVSIHCNSAGSAAAEGTETFHYYGSSSGKKLAGYIQSQLLDTMESVDRGVKEAGYYVIKYTDAPAVLVELDFISNPEREDYLNNNIKETGDAIARGITDYVSSL